MTGWVWVGGRQTPLSNFTHRAGGPSMGGQVTLSDGDRAVLEWEGFKIIVNVLKPPRAAVPHFSAALLPMVMLLPYFIGVTGLLFGGLLIWFMVFPPDIGEQAAGGEDERYELISQNDLTLLAPQPVDQPEEQPVDEEEVDEGPVEEVPPDQVVRTTRRARVSRSGSATGGSAAAQLISALSSGGGGGGASLQDVITNIDAVGSSNVSALFRTSGIISKLPGGEVKLARRGTAGGVSTLGGSALKAAAPGIGTLEGGSTGRTGKIRGTVSRVSSLMRVSGSLDRGEVLRVINRHIGQITRCYETRLVSNPGLSGQVAFNWVVTESGGVSGVSVRSSTLPDPQVASCISGIIRRMRFPQPQGGSVQISFPFVFRAVE
jgi:hypothetical protein